MNDTEEIFDTRCECGKTFRLKQRHLGTELICPNCDRRLEVPTVLTSVDGHLVSGASNEENEFDKRTRWAVEWRMLGIGIIWTIAGVGLFFVALASRAGGFGFFGFVLILMGVCAIIKGCLGPLAEWD